MVKIKTTLQEKGRVACRAEGYAPSIETDLSKVYGGYGEMMGPTELVAAALGSCILLMMRLKGKQLGVDLTGATAEVDKEIVSDPHVRIGSLHVVVTLPVQCDGEIATQLERAAVECPVHKSLAPDVDQTISFRWGTP